MATDLRNRYREDFFFRTEVNIIFTQIIFAVSILILIGIAFSYLYKDITKVILEGITQNLNTNNPVSGETILQSARNVQNSHFIILFLAIIIITTILGYFIARVALKPTRNALTSQKRFVSNIAHELRTPLAIIKTNSEIALLDEQVSAKARKVVESNIEELDRASEIINNLLSLSNLIRLEKMKFETVNLSTVIDSSIKKLSMLVKSKKMEVIVKRTGPHNVYGNATALEQVIVNLLKNALNYSSPASQITIVVGPDFREDWKNVVLTVQDNGIGISRKDLFHIFEPFFRAEKSRNRQSGSSGLGLTIVSEIVKMHGGKISIKSIENQGTNVSIFFPFGSNKKISQKQRMRENEISVDYLNREDISL